MNAAALACAGMGFFFIGMRLISSHLRDLASGSIRRVLIRALNHPALASVSGLLAGGLTQSTSAVTFIATGLVSARALSLTVAVSLLAWANAGTSMLVLLASFNVHAVALYLLGVIGLAFFTGLDQNERARHTTYALFGLALLLYGISLIKGSVSSVRDDFWVREFVEFSASGPDVSLLAGYVLAIALQSSSVVVALALPLVSEGLVNLHGMTILILGACAGSGTAVVLLSSGLEGPARQLALTQGLVRGLASVVLLPIAVMEGTGYVPSIDTLFRAVTLDIGAQVGLVFLIVQLTGVLVARLLRQPILKLSARAAPPSPAEALAKAAYIYDEAAADPTTALELIRLEHIRLVQALPEFLDDLRSHEERGADAAPLALRAAASHAVAIQMEEFLGEVLCTNPEMAVERVFDVRRRLGDLVELQKALEKFARELSSVPEVDRPRFTHSLIEGLHALLVVVTDACAEDGDDARYLLGELTAERGALVDRVRAELLAGSAALSGREAVLSAVLLLERILWILRERAPLPFDTHPVSV
jgi:phosphate:Na+ symporter